jgi:glycerophosphoryl diester phosphodiesterase
MEPLQPGATPSGSRRGGLVPGRPLRLAHRGHHRRWPENSLAAFRAALDLPGCDGVEFDVRLSGDGMPIVLHDATLERVQGRRERAADLTAGRLEALGVPALASALAALPMPAFIDLELKEDAARAVVDLLLSARGPDLANAAVSSFDGATLAHVAELMPAWRLWLNANDLGEGTVAGATRLGCAGVSVHWTAIDRRRVARARAAGLEVAAWTVRRRPTFDRLARLGVVAECVEGAALSV